MQPLTVNEIREKFLSFFESKGHLRLPSFSLVPQNDKSLLLINAGMTPLKPYFTGLAVPPRERVTTCQKCVRTIDIDEVGHDGRHLSFFQMLGNFSFAEYFKKEAIEWAWEFMTEVVKFPLDKLYVSVYQDDDEAYELWNKGIGLDHSRIFKLGKEDNFWEHGTGPCGPCSEIYFDRGEKYGCDNPNCEPGCECDRFMEVWNLVFIQYDKQADGQYDNLVNTGIDTGMGLERMALVMQQVDSAYEIDTFAKYQKKVRELTNTPQPDPKKDISVRIITDHIHSIMYMTADGILPSNEGRGYVLRRLLRRAVRHAKLLGRDTPFIAELCPLIIKENSNAYPELMEKQAHVLQVLTTEEERFFATLDTGMSMLEEMCKGKSALTGADVFRLYDTYGFPPELTREMLEEKGLSYNEKEFEKEMENQRHRARAARGESNYMGADETVFNKMDATLSTEFEGYSKLSVQARVLALAVGQELSNTAEAGNETVAVILDRTSFYAESGGQKGDQGSIILPGGKVEVHDCQKIVGKWVHLGVVTEGSISVNDMVTAEVDNKRRQATARNHTATHLLARALRKTLGDHIEQAGSEVSADRLRFDFTHFAAVEDLKAVEDEVNKSIFAGMDIDIKEMPLEEARKAGAVMLMGEKSDQYGATVRVINIGQGASVELCGGTHISNTSQIGVFKLISEGSVAAGVRRIEAVTGSAALAEFRAAEETLQEAAMILKTTPDGLLNRAQSINNELRQAKQELESIKSKQAVSQSAELLDNQEEYKGLTWLSAGVKGLDANGLRTMGDQIKEKVDVLLLASSTEGGPVQFVAHASKKAVEAGVHAGNIVKEAATICGGNGGGRPNTAQAGGKDSSKAEEALQTAINNAKTQLR